MFRKVFVGWFVALTSSFLVANLIGVIRPMGLLPFRETGFPFTFAVWGVGVEQYFDYGLLILNLLTGVLASGVIAYLLAWQRYRSRRSGSTDE
jgi:hypothetical protein